MTVIVIEILLLLFLLLANGEFAMTEMAVVSSRRSRLQQLAEGGDARASLALDPSCARPAAPNRQERRRLERLDDSITRLAEDSIG